MSSEKYTVVKVKGKWYYHPTNVTWNEANAATDFSPPYPTKNAAAEAANVHEHMDESDIDGPIMDGNGKIWH